MSREELEKILDTHLGSSSIRFRGTKDWIIDAMEDSVKKALAPYQFKKYPEEKPYDWQHVNICYDGIVSMAIFEDGNGFHLIQEYHPRSEGICITGELYWAQLPPPIK